MPANLPPPLMQQVYNQALQQIQVTRVEPVDYEIFHAMLESTRLRSDFKTRGKITAMRLPDMNITVNIAPTFQGWTDYKS